MKVNANQNKAIIKFYNRINECDVEYLYEIPAPQLKLLLLFSYKELVAPFVRELLIKGASAEQITRDYKLSRREIRTISYKMGYSTR